MNREIKINCDCGKVHNITRDSDAPDDAISMGCNWCPDCESKANDYYDEWYNYPEEGEIESDDPKQLMMFSIADEILNKETPELLTTKE